MSKNVLHTSLASKPGFADYLPYGHIFEGDIEELCESSER